MDSIQKTLGITFSQSPVEFLRVEKNLTEEFLA